MLRSLGGGWTALPTARVEDTLQLLANTDRLGTFVAAAPEAMTARQLAVWAAYLVAAIGLALAVAGTLARHRRTPDNVSRHR